ncbi:hypothetical protein QJS04_geneDACA014837 [Acorus gramineus]|uniref:Histidine kinase/HSP90-like ATPase domain-containing protein n=1 Tax=Acorus gramineus TaxID=55184 RepID=A0AAV9A341_ACOGR|nr:hypothetical protein QJS04_geneDACA023543 [Acorus gramineus]KAK1258588.1 hypothetical protein QJS04_geneDACA014837 [Acorus gramineus]
MLLSSIAIQTPALNPPFRPRQSFLLRPLSALRNPKQDTLRHHHHHQASSTAGSDGALSVASAAAVAAAIRRASSASPVDFSQRVEREGLVLPSTDFLKLCAEQLELFRSIVHGDAVLSVYVRPAGSYVMDQLELRRVTVYPGAEVAESTNFVILIGNFTIPAGLRAAEATLSNQQVEVIPEWGAVVLPMIKHPFVVGFLVAEFPAVQFEACETAQTDSNFALSTPPDAVYQSSSRSDRLVWEIEDLTNRHHWFSTEQRSRAIKISRSLAVAYVMDQKSMLLQHSSWQNSVRIGELVDQIRAPLSSIRTLSSMLALHMKKSEISYDIIGDILVQGNHIKDALEQLQDAVYFTKSNIVRFNEETLKKLNTSTYGHPESMRSQLSGSLSNDKSMISSERVPPLDHVIKDMEMPMPPLALAPLQQHKVRPCTVSDVLADLVGAAVPLARKQLRHLELTELSKPLQVAVEESALRQALSNLIEGALLRTHVGGKVNIISSGAPAGGALIIIDDDGPDMHYMTQMHSLTPFGTDLFSDGMVEDNMTWNFIAGLTVAREILETYGCVVRVISPRSPDAAIGAGGTRVEVWLPFLVEPAEPTQDA